MNREKLNKYGNKIIRNGCHSKKELREWVRKQVLEKSLRKFIEEKEAGIIQ